VSQSFYECRAESWISFLNPLMERRQDVRYRLTVPVVFSWESSKGKRLQGEGTTRDLSVAGAFVYTSTCPAPDTNVFMDVLLPPLQQTAPAVTMQMEARVLRVEHPAEGTGRSGFAVASQKRDRNGFELVRIRYDKEMSEHDEKPPGRKRDPDQALPN